MTNLNTNLSTFAKAVTPAAKDAAKVDTTQAADTAALPSPTAGLVGKDLSQELALLARGKQDDLQRQRVDAYLKTLPPNADVQAVQAMVREVLNNEFKNLSPRASNLIAAFAASDLAARSV